VTSTTSPIQECTSTTTIATTTIDRCGSRGGARSESPARRARTAEAERARIAARSGPVPPKRSATRIARAKRVRTAERQ
jgi:hypothetical protein